MLSVRFSCEIQSSMSKLWIALVALVVALEAQTTRRILLENGELMTKRKDLRLQGGTGSKAGGDQREKGDEKRAHRGGNRIS